MNEDLVTITLTHKEAYRLRMAAHYYANELHEVTLNWPQSFAKTDSDNDAYSLLEIEYQIKRAMNDPKEKQP